MGFTFPLGVYTVAITTLAKDLPSSFFKVLGTIFSIMVVLLWLIVSLKTFQRAATGKLFFAPASKGMRNRWRKRKQPRRMQINRESLSKLVQQQEHQPWIIWICYLGGSVRPLVFCLSLLSVLCFVEVFLYPLATPCMCTSWQTFVRPMRLPSTQPATT